MGLFLKFGAPPHFVPKTSICVVLSDIMDYFGRGCSGEGASGLGCLRGYVARHRVRFPLPLPTSYLVDIRSEIVKLRFR